MYDMATAEPLLKVVWQSYYMLYHFWSKLTCQSCKQFLFDILNDCKRKYSLSTCKFKLQLWFIYHSLGTSSTFCTVFTFFDIIAASTMAACSKVQKEDLTVSFTRSSAIAEGPRDASCQLKSCQLPRNSAVTTYTTSPDQIHGMKLEI